MIAREKTADANVYKKERTKNNTTRIRQPLR